MGLVLLGSQACMSDEETEGEGDAEVPSAGLLEQSNTPSVEIPEELTLDSSNPDGGFEAQACRVKLLYCRDPRHGRRATYCSNGCSAIEALVTASVYVAGTCGGSSGQLLNLGGC